MEYPIHQYKSLHALFTRRLIDHVRPVDQSTRTLTSPVDGIINDSGKVSPGKNLYIKNKLYSVEKILGDSKKAEAYKNGHFFVLYLSPSHYHRMHYPVKGELLSRWALGGKSYPVNSLGERWGNSPFSTNYRIISEIATPFGKMAIVKVGALNINSIQLTNTSSEFEKGEELGYFSFGSTVILFIEPNDLFKAKATAFNAEVKVGQVIGEWLAQ